MKNKYGETASFTGRLPVFFFSGGVFLFLVGLGCVACSRQAEVSLPVGVTFTSNDGFELVATLYVPETEKPPGILLLHRYGGNRRLWEQVARRLQQQGILALAVDLRGHGESDSRQGEAIHYRQLPEDGWIAALQDVRAAKAVLLEKGADVDNLAIAGEGLGAALALHYALEDSQIQGVVMVSPGLELQGVATEEAMKCLDDCPSLLFASEGDAYAATSASALNQAAPVYSELRTWHGGAHGVDLFAANPEAIEFMVQWLCNIFKSDDS